MVAPFANYWNETSLKAIILGIFVYVIGMVMYVTSRKNYMPGQEFGTAVFADPKKVAKQFLMAVQAAVELMALDMDLAVVVTVIPDRMEASMNIISKAAIRTIY